MYGIVNHGDLFDVSWGEYRSVGLYLRVHWDAPFRTLPDNVPGNDSIDKVASLMR